MTVPSCSICVVSEVAVAENGALFTTFPGRIPSNPSSSMRSPIAPGGPPSSGMPSCSIIIGGGGSGGAASCARTAPALSKAPPTIEQAQKLRFIFFSSSLLELSKMSPLSNATLAIAPLSVARPGLPADPLGSSHSLPLHSPAIPARQARRASCQDSCSAAQREQPFACAAASARAASLAGRVSGRSNPIASNSSHVISRFLVSISFLPQSRLPGVHREASRASPAATRGRDADATESCRSDNQASSPLPHNSALPTRTAPPLRETPPANPRRLPGRARRALVAQPNAPV